MLKNAFFFAALLCCFVCSPHLLEAQKQKSKRTPSFETIFFEKQELSERKEEERKLAMLWGLFSDVEFRKNHPSESMFEQPTDVVHFPIWQNRWNGLEEGWFYMARFFPAQANRPLTQYIAKFRIEGNSLKITQYNFKTEQKIQKFWQDFEKFEEISVEELSPLDCHLQGRWEQGIWLMETTRPCEVAMPIGIQYTSLDGKISLDAWFMQITFKNAKDEVFYQDAEPVVFQRLSPKEIKKRLKFYENPKS